MERLWDRIMFEISTNPVFAGIGFGLLIVFVFVILFAIL